MNSSRFSFILNNGALSFANMLPFSMVNPFSL